MEEPRPVLVVEDEHMVQDIVKDALNEGGFGVVIASSREEAVELLDADETKYRALVTDIKLGQGRIQDGKSPSVREKSIQRFRSST